MRDVMEFVWFDDSKDIQSGLSFASARPLALFYPRAFDAT